MSMTIVSQRLTNRTAKVNFNLRGQRQVILGQAQRRRGKVNKPFVLNFKWGVQIGGQTRNHKGCEINVGKRIGSGHSTVEGLI